jgi:hypothetical protein
LRQPLRDGQHGEAQQDQYHGKCSYVVHALLSFQSDRCWEGVCPTGTCGPVAIAHSVLFEQFGEEEKNSRLFKPKHSEKTLRFLDNILSSNITDEERYQHVVEYLKGAKEPIMVDVICKYLLASREQILEEAAIPSSSPTPSNS